MSIKYDLQQNLKNTKGLIFILIFRLSHFLSKNIVLKVIGFPIRFFYKIIIEWFMGIEIPDSTNIGEGLIVFHGQSLIVHNKTIIGKNVILRHNTTIGNSKSGGNSPIIADYVDIGANCVVIGDILIGENSIIGAGSVVVKSVPANSVVVGNPARVISKNIK